MTPHDREIRAPRFARTLIALVTSPDDRAFVLADLGDEFARLRSARGWWAARAWYWRQALAAIRPGIGRRLDQRDRLVGVDPRRPRRLMSIGSDVTYALRRLRQAPLVALVTIVSLALGIGATTTVFSVANSLLLHDSSAIADPDGVLAIYTVPASDPVFGQTSFPDFVTLSTEVQSLQSVAAVRVAAVQLGDGERGRPAMVEMVTPQFFEVLGARPSVGRVFSDEEGQPGRAERVAVLSHDFWQRNMGGRPDVLGEKIRLDGKLFTIIGVGPEDLRSRLADLRLVAWVPVGLPGGFYHATDLELTDRADREYAVLARARPEYSTQQVDAELSLVATRLHDEYGDAWENEGNDPFIFRVVAGNPGLLPPEFGLALGATAAVALAGALLILLIACANVAGLLLAQGHERRQEIAVRAALGAGRGRLVRMLFVESAMLALVSCAAGMLVTRGVLTSISSVALPIGVPFDFNFTLDVRVLAFAVGMSLVACFAFGLLPALAGSRAALVPGLKAGRRTPAGGGSMRIRRLLIVGQVAASLVLLVGAGLLLRSTANVLSSDLGFSTDRIAVVSKDFSFDDRDAPKAMVALRELAGRIEAHPEIEQVALSTAVERVFDDMTIADVRPDTYDGGDEPLLVRLNAVDPEYLTMLQLEIAGGRSLTSNDQLGSDRVALVNQAFASRHWPGQSPIGHTMRLKSMRQPGTTNRGLDDLVTVVGVVRDPIAPDSVGSGGELGAASVVGVNARIWVPLAQYPSTRVMIHARSRTSAAAIVPILREETGLDEVPLIAAQPLEDLIAFPMKIQASVGRVMRWGGLFALVLSFLGIYGIVSFAVTERSREMAIRKALGARQDEVVRRVMRHGLTLAVWGVAVGLTLTIPVAFLARHDLAAVHPLDPVAIGGGVGVILLAALLASGLPARRLASVDPMAVLRDE